MSAVRKHADKWNLARRAGDHVVRKICVVVFSLRRSVSFCGTENWNLARRAGGQVVRKICVVVFALRRSVSFCGTENWNLAASPN